MPLNDALKKVSGLFFEADPEEPKALASTLYPAAPSEPASRATKSIEQIAREQPGPNLDEIKVPSTTPAGPTEPIERADGSIDYAAIYALAGLPASPFTAEQVLEILNSLPAELPLGAKRATMKVTLNAMGAALGVTPETVVADASRKLTALGAYAGSYTDQAAQYVEKAQAEIARMEGEIARRRETIETAKSRQAHMVEACNKEADRLDDVLEFFSLDAGASKHAPPA